MKLQPEEKAVYGLIAGMFGILGIYILSIIGLICAVIYGIYRLIVHFL